MYDPYQVLEARETAISLGMDVLVETHDEQELQRASRLRSRLLGINNKDLRTLRASLTTTEELSRKVPPGRVLVSESGLNGRGDLERLRRCGVSTFLIGESLMHAADVETATRELLAGPEQS